jgi:hypothetical protein
MQRVQSIAVNSGTTEAEFPAVVRNCRLVTVAGVVTTDATVQQRRVAVVVLQRGSLVPVAYAETGEFGASVESTFALGTGLQPENVCGPLWRDLIITPGMLVRVLMVNPAGDSIGDLSAVLEDL